MPTFANNEALSSVRQKINTAIEDVEWGRGGFATVADLLNNSTLTNDGTLEGQIFTAGGFRYQRAASTATDHHVTTAGGVKLKVLEDGANIRAFGAAVDDSTDDTAAVQKMVDAFGYFRLPIGTAKITDTIVIPANVFGHTWSGESKERSALHCVGMVGKNAIEPAAGTGLWRVGFRDFKVYGDCDTCIDLTTTGEFYASLLSNLWLQSAAGPALNIPSGFSFDIISCNFFSDDDHSVILDGGPGTNLYGCSANRCGAGKAGYRIYREANLFGCNGLDSGDIWGVFGAATAIDGFDAQFRINLVGCNLEDFGTHAIDLRFTGALIVMTCAFIPKATGTYETLIKGDVYGGAGWELFSRGSFVSSKGSTMSGASRILHKAQPGIIDVSGAFTNWHDTITSGTYASLNSTTTNPAAAISARKIPFLDCDRLYGFVAQVPTLWAVNAASMSLERRNTIRTANTAATTIQTASGGVIGQELRIIIEDANTTIKHNHAANGRFLNTSATDITAASGDVYTYVSNGTNWVQQ